MRSARLRTRGSWTGTRPTSGERFGDAESFSIISRVLVVEGNGLTPDWTVEENRLLEWSEAAE